MIDYEEIEKAGGIGKGEDHYARGRRLRKEASDFEDAEKDKVRALDKRCRWPRCENCRKHQHVALHVAHVVQAKGIGGDHGTRSTADQMMLLDAITHSEQEKHRKDVRPLTSAGTRGACEFWVKRNGEWHLVAKESAPFSYERD